MNRKRSGSSTMTNLINLDRLWALGQKLREITSLQERPFQSLASPSTLREAIMSERVLDANELFNLSKLREPKGGFHEALRTANSSNNKVRRSSRPKPQTSLSMVDLSDCLVPNIAGVLGDREWSFLMTSAVLKQYGDRDIILTEEKPFSCFYRYNIKYTKYFILLLNVLRSGSFKVVYKYAVFSVAVCSTLL